MTEEEIKQIVCATVDELQRRKLLTEETDLSYRFMGSMLKQFYKNGHNAEKINEALKCLERDPYINIIPLYYRDNKTITAISICESCDRATVTRNKKRLVLELYNIVYSE